MSINDALGANGIFISNVAREKLNIKISEDEFEALKKQIPQDLDPNTQKKCFITGAFVPVSKGVMISKEWMAKAMKMNLQKADETWGLFKKDNIVICKECGKRSSYNSRHVTCPCGEEIDTKKYKKMIKMPFAQRMALKSYIGFLEGRSGRGIK